MFHAGDAWYGVAMPSQVVRSVDGLRGFTYGADAVRRRRDPPLLRVVPAGAPGTGDAVHFRCFEAPERIYRTLIDTSGDWHQWTPGPVSEVMRPTEPWEGADEPLKPVARGLAASPQNGLRDPCLLEAGGRRWLYYAASGEHAIGVTEL